MANESTVYNACSKLCMFIYIHSQQIQIKNQNLFAFMCLEVKKNLILLGKSN